MQLLLLLIQYKVQPIMPFQSYAVAAHTASTQSVNRTRRVHACPTIVSARRCIVQPLRSTVYTEFSVVGVQYARKMNGIIQDKKRTVHTACGIH